MAELPGQDDLSEHQYQDDKEKHPGYTAPLWGVDCHSLSRRAYVLHVVGIGGDLQLPLGIGACQFVLIGPR